jgi:GNAT superfamily N-acetyltransferase
MDLSQRRWHGEEDVALLPCSEGHLSGALALSQEMSWPYRLADWEFAFELGRGCVLERAGTVVGTAFWWPYGETDASTGMIIVSRSEQGRGYGARLMDAVLAAAGSRVIQLNSTAEGRVLYERRGFRPIGMIHQHHGIVAGPSTLSPTCPVRKATPGDREVIGQLDCEATGWSRDEMLGRLIDVSDVHVLERDGRVRGYVVSRLFGRGHVVGPVVAEDAADARMLILAALAPLSGRFARIDTSSTSGLGDWLVALGLERVSEALTMVRGNPAPLRGPARRFALANQSFG